MTAHIDLVSISSFETYLEPILLTTTGQSGDLFTIDAAALPHLRLEAFIYDSIGNTDSTMWRFSVVRGVVRPLLVDCGSDNLSFKLSVAIADGVATVSYTGNIEAIHLYPKYNALVQDLPVTIPTDQDTTVQIKKITGVVPRFLGGNDADKPDAGTLPTGDIYIAYDTKLLYRDNGTAWDVLGASSSGGSSAPDVELDIAATGTDASTAFQLTKSYNQVTASVTNFLFGDLAYGLLLPVAVPGTQIVVAYSTGAGQYVKVFAQDGATIDGISDPAQINRGNARVFYAVSETQWTASYAIYAPVGADLDLNGFGFANVNNLVFSGAGEIDGVTALQTGGDLLINANGVLKLNGTAVDFTNINSSAPTALTGVLDPVNAQDAATKSYVDSHSWFGTGDLPMNGFTIFNVALAGMPSFNVFSRIHDLADPSAPRDATNKQYVDAALSAAPQKVSFLFDVFFGGQQASPIAYSDLTNIDGTQAFQVCSIPLPLDGSPLTITLSARVGTDNFGMISNIKITYLGGGIFLNGTSHTTTYAALTSFADDTSYHIYSGPGSGGTLDASLQNDPQFIVGNPTSPDVFNLYCMGPTSLTGDYRAPYAITYSAF